MGDLLEHAAGSPFGTLPRAPHDGIRLGMRGITPQGSCGAGRQGGSTMKNMLDERARPLLKTLVERYIAEGQPVDSRTLVARQRTRAVAGDDPQRDGRPGTWA